MCSASHTPPTGDLAHNPGICPDWEVNWQPFGLQAITLNPLSEPHQPGMMLLIFFRQNTLACPLTKVQMFS